MWPPQPRRDVREETLLGAQIDIFREIPELPERLPALFRTLAAAGCQTIEANIDEMPRTRRDLTQAGLKFLGQRTTPSRLEDLEPLMQTCMVYESKHIIVSGPLHPEEETEEEFLATALFLQEVGDTLRRHRIRLLYHNREFEFAGPLGDAPMRILLENTKPTCLGLCFDPAAMWRAGGDFERFIARHANRIEVVHLRDWKGDVSVPLGRGDVPIEEISKHFIRIIRFQAMVVEQDPGVNKPLDDMVESLEYIQDLVDNKAPFRRY